MSWMNVALKERHDQPVYCVPNNLVLTGDKLIDIIRKEVEKTPSLATSPVGLTILFGLEDEFLPCKPNSK
jgi:hypothetical protein